jgi:hypothetical protein
MPATPNDVIISSATGGLYDGETIGFTAPSGKLGAGNYDIILDLCADGYYDPGVDYLYGADMPNGAFSVVLPANVPALPSSDIQALKSQAQSEVSGWNKSALSSAALFALYDAYSIWSDLADPGETLEEHLIYGVNFYLDWGCLAMPNPLGRSGDALVSYRGLERRHGPAVPGDQAATGRSLPLPGHRERPRGPQLHRPRDPCRRPHHLAQE